jgi:hypothetical protein
MKDKVGPDSYLYGLDAEDSTGTQQGSRRAAREGAEIEALLGEETPPAPLWRRLQAQLRREGIIID